MAVITKSSDYYLDLITPIHEVEKLYKKISRLFFKAGKEKKYSYLKDLNKVLDELHYKEKEFWTLAYNITSK